MLVSTDALLTYRRRKSITQKSTSSRYKTSHSLSCFKATKAQIWAWTERTAISSSLPTVRSRKSSKTTKTCKGNTTSLKPKGTNGDRSTKTWTRSTKIWKVKLSMQIKLCRSKQPNFYNWRSNSKSPKKLRTRSKSKTLKKLRASLDIY